MTRIVLVGPQPPPLHGMSAVNAAVSGRLRDAGTSPLVIDIAAHSLSRAWWMRIGRLPRVLVGLWRLGRVEGARGGVLYISVSSGPGQVFEALFVALGRMRGMRRFLHHHSYAYLDRPRPIARVLFALAGRAATHVVMTPGMAARLRGTYPRIQQVVPASNAAILPENGGGPPQPRVSMRTIGFLSNVSPEKGIFEFLDVAAALESSGVPVRAEIVGPFCDAETERRVRERLSCLARTEYLGPRYGSEKIAFLDGIDTLVYPTHADAEPLVVHEALMRGVPVIAYGIGTISEMLTSEAGVVVRAGDDFVGTALAQIEIWRTAPEALRGTSLGAHKRFAAMHAQATGQWNVLLKEIVEYATRRSPGQIRARRWQVLRRLMARIRKGAVLVRHAADLSGLRVGVAAAIEHEKILRTIPCRTVIDIGANRGQFALIAHRCFPDARIVSFEPLQEPADTFRRLFNGDPRVVLHEAAVAPHRGSATMHVSRQNDSSSLLPITPLQERLFPGTGEVGTRAVHVAPLGAFLRSEDIAPPAMLKLDVQGFELEALKGCSDLLGAFRYIYVECSYLELYLGQALADDVTGWLRERGFVLDGAYNTAYDGAGRAVQSDLLFRARDHSAPG